MHAANKRSRWLKGRRMFPPLGSMEKICGLPRRWWRRAKKVNQHEPFPMPFYGVWEAVARFTAEIRTSDFMAKMTRRRDAHGSEGLMGSLDCATLYALTCWQRPAVVVESGGFIGMSSAFILKAFVDEGLATAKLHSIEWSEECEQGALIPDELRPRFVPLPGKIEDFVSSATSCPPRSTCLCTIVRTVTGTCFGSFVHFGRGCATADYLCRTMSI